MSKKKINNIVITSSSHLLAEVNRLDSGLPSLNPKLFGNLCNVRKFNALMKYLMKKGIKVYLGGSSVQRALYSGDRPADVDILVVGHQNALERVMRPLLDVGQKPQRLNRLISLNRHKFYVKLNENILNKKYLGYTFEEHLSIFGSTILFDVCFVSREIFDANNSL